MKLWKTKPIVLFLKRDSLASSRLPGVLAVDDDAAARGLVDATDDVEQRRLAASRRPHEADALARLHFQADADEGRGLGFFQLIVLLYVSYADQCHRFPPRDGCNIALQEGRRGVPKVMSWS